MSLRTVAALAPLLALVLVLIGCTQPPAQATDRVAAPTRPARSTATPLAGPVSPLQSSQSTQDAHITITDAPRNGVPLPTFLRATAEELERDARIEVVTTKIDGDLRPDRVPAAVITFHLTGSNDTGRQYILPHDDRDRYVIVTCIGTLQELGTCLKVVDSVSLSDPD